MFNSILSFLGMLFKNRLERMRAVIGGWGQESGIDLLLLYFNIYPE